MNGHAFRTPLFRWGFDAWNSSQVTRGAPALHHSHRSHRSNSSNSSSPTHPVPQALSPDCLAAQPEVHRVFPAQFLKLKVGFAQGGWRCIMAQYAAPYIKTPVFLVNSALDSCQARHTAFARVIIVTLCAGQRLRARHGCLQGPPPSPTTLILRRGSLEQRMGGDTVTHAAGLALPVC